MADTQKPYGDVQYADPGYQADKKKRYPIDSADHVKAAWSYINQAGNSSKYSADQLASIKGRIKAAAKKFGVEISGGGMNAEPVEGETRSVPFEVRTAGGDDGLTFEGYAAVYNSPTRIRSAWEGEFDEVILPGAFKRALADRTPVLMFEHGQHPLIGSMPLGVITRAEEDAHGLAISARLSDNWLVQPVRDAVRDGAVDGMSFRFSVDDAGETWTKRSGDVQLRAIHDFRSVPEVGPVVFPAYTPTTAAVRSQLDRIPDLTGRPGARSAGGGDRGTEPGTGEEPTLPSSLRTRDRVWRMKGILHG